MQPNWKSLGKTETYGKSTFSTTKFQHISRIISMCFHNIFVRIHRILLWRKSQNLWNPHELNYCVKHRLARAAMSFHLAHILLYRIRNWERNICTQPPIVFHKLIRDGFKFHILHERQSVFFNVWFTTIQRTTMTIRHIYSPVMIQMFFYKKLKLSLFAQLKWTPPYCLHTLHTSHNI